MKVATAAIVLIGGCFEATTPASTSGAVRMRVSVPEGWTATPKADRLEAGPARQPVVVLESKPQFPTLNELRAAARSAGTSEQGVEETSDFVAVLYSVDSDAGVADSFVAARAIEGKNIWCASLRRIDRAMITDALAVCRQVTVDKVH